MDRTNATGATPAGGAFPNGSTTIGNARITGLVFLASEIKIGYFVTASAGFPSATQPYEVVDCDAAAGWIDLELNATAMVAGTVTVTTQQYFYTDGNAGAYARTILAARDRNYVQEEICNVIEDNGDALDATDRTQLSNAVLKRGVNQTMNGDLTIAAGQALFTNGIGKTSGTQIVVADLMSFAADIKTNQIQSASGGIVSAIETWRRKQKIQTVNTIAISAGGRAGSITPTMAELTKIGFGCQVATLTAHGGASDAFKICKVSDIWGANVLTKESPIRIRAHASIHLTGGAPYKSIFAHGVINCPQTAGDISGIAFEDGPVESNEVTAGARYAYAANDILESTFKTNALAQSAEVAIIIDHDDEFMYFLNLTAGTVDNIVLGIEAEAFVSTIT